MNENGIINYRIIKFILKMNLSNIKKVQIAKNTNPSSTLKKIFALP
jgi:hypothetical protein